MAPGILHLTGDRGIYGGAAWETTAQLGRRLDDFTGTAGDETIVDADGGFHAEDIGAEVLAINPNVEPFSRGWELTRVVPPGTSIEGITDANHALLTDPLGADPGDAVLIIGARDLTGATFAGAIAAAPLVEALVELDVSVLTGAPRGRLRIALTADDTGLLVPAIGSPYPSVPRGVYSVWRTDGTPEPTLTGDVSVTDPVEAP